MIEKRKVRTHSAADAAFGTAKCGMTYLSDHADQLVGATGGVLSKAALQRASLVLTAGAAIHNYFAYQLSRGLEVGGRTVTVITAPSRQRETPTTCEHPDGYALTYPSGWRTYPSDGDPDFAHLHCSLFGTAPMQSFEPGTEFPWVPIRVHVWDGLPFEITGQPEFRAGESSMRDVESRHTLVAGRPALRVVSVSEASEVTSYSLPRGTEIVSWYVDLSTDTADRVLLGSAIPLASAETGVTNADKAADGATTVDTTAKVLDAMMASLILAD